MWLIFRNTVTKVIATQKKLKMIRITFTGKLNQKKFSKLMSKLLKTNQEIKEKLKKVNLTGKQRKTKEFRRLLKNFAITLRRKF